MVVLGMDTATQITAVGLGKDTHLLGSSAYAVPRGHSRLLQPTLSSVLQSCGVKPSDIERIAVGVGPGSYTGVRLGVATAKAMATALNCPLVLVSTLAMMASAAEPAVSGKTSLVLPMLYARRQRAFGAVYRKQGEAWTIPVPQQVLSVQAWMETVAELKNLEPGAEVVVVHDFVPKYEVLHELETSSIGRTVCLTDVAGGLGGALFKLAVHPDANVVRGSEIHAVVPDYALQVEAEVKLAERGPGEHGHG